MARLQLSFLGSVQIRWHGGDELRFRSRSELALLAYLAVESQQHSRATLLGLLWPDQPEENARNNLRVTLSRLRSRLGDTSADTPFLLTTRNTVQFNAASPHSLDVAEFAELSKLADTLARTDASVDPGRHERLRQAVELYRDEFLAGFYLDDAPAFDEWLLLQRERLHLRVLKALWALVDADESQAEYARAIHYAQRQIELDPLKEDAHRQLIRILARSGQRSAALAAYERCRQNLIEELGVEPSQETVALHKLVRSGAFDGAPAGRMASKRTEDRGFSRPHNLPAAMTALVGREQEMQDVVDSLKRADCRLLTVTGVGGVGKTRLALSAAHFHRRRETFADGHLFVPLAGVDPPPAAEETEQVLAQAIASALNISLYEDRSPTRQLIDRLRSREMLLVLDNLEHLLGGVELVARLLAAAPGVKVLATSRQPLELYGEWLYALAEMPVPPVTAGEPEQYDSVRFFVQSAQRVQPHFTLTAENRAQIAALCRAVGGLPLALELAASWLQGLTLDEIAAGMEQGLTFLTTSHRNVSRRHRSIRAVFEHSWQLLSADEQRILAGCSVFRGGFSFEAAVRVAEAPVNILVRLVGKSLLQRGSTGRYSIHELLRQYLQEKLAARAEESIVKRRHSRYYAAFLQKWQSALKGEGQQSALRAIRGEIDNLRAGWHWAIAQGDLTLIEQAMESLFHFYNIQGWFQEGLDAFTAATTLHEAHEVDEWPAACQVLLGKALARAGWFALRLGHYVAAKEKYQRALCIARQHQSVQEVGFALDGLGGVAMALGDLDTAVQHLEDSAAVFEKAGDRWSSALAGKHLSFVAHSLGKYQWARQLLEESLAVFRQIGDRREIASTLTHLGIENHVVGRQQQAKALLTESLAALKGLNDPIGAADALDNLGDVMAALGDYEAAQDYYQQSYDLGREIGEPRLTAVALNALGYAAFMRGSTVEAVRHLQGSLSLAKEIGARSVIATALRHLGSAVAEQGKYAEAQQHYQESFALFQEIGYRWNEAVTLVRLAELATVRSDPKQAQHYFLEALRLATKLQAFPLTLEILVGVAGFFVETGKAGKALAPLLLVLHDSRSRHEHREKAEELLALLPPQLVEEGNKTATWMDCGTETIEAVVDEILQTT